MDKEFNFNLGPALISLSSSSQLKQLPRLDPPYLKDYEDLVNKCVDHLDCVEVGNLIQSSGIVPKKFSFGKKIMFQE